MYVYSRYVDICIDCEYIDRYCRYNWCREWWIGDHAPTRWQEQDVIEYFNMEKYDEVKIFRDQKIVENSWYTKFFPTQKIATIKNLVVIDKMYLVYVDISIVDIHDIDRGGSRFIECTGALI